MRQMLQMVEKAKETYGKISYCGNASSWKECFTTDNGYLMFWFNIDADTKMIREKIDDDFRLNSWLFFLSII
jgi:hypothetical protein